MKGKGITIIIWLFLLCLAGGSLTQYFNQKSRADRLESNLIAANQREQQFKTRDNHQASKILSQESTIAELRRSHPEVISQFKNLYIPPRLAQSYTEISQEFKAEIKAPITDSIPEATGINSDAREPEKMKVLQFQDKWISIHGVLDPDTAKIKVLAKDTIFTAIYKGERRRPWLWVLSKRQLTTSATNRSPYVSVHVINSGIIKH